MVTNATSEQHAHDFADLRPGTLNTRRSPILAGLLAEFRDMRAVAAAAERAERTRTLAERREAVADVLAEFRDMRAVAAAAERAERARTLAERQAAVANVLAAFRDTRAVAAERARRQAEVALRRELVAGQIAVRERDDGPKLLVPASPAATRSSTGFASVGEHKNGNAGAPVSRTGASTLPDLGYAGLVAYAQMTRVAILRELERGEPGSEALQRQLEAHLESLRSNLRPLLDEVAALSSADGPRKTQLLETVEGVRRSVETLSSDLGALPWPTAPEQQKAFAATIARLYDRIKPLQEQLENATARLHPAQARSRPNPRGRSQSKARPALAQETDPRASTGS